MKYFYYISKPKVEMLLPQVQRAWFSLKLSPKVDVAGVSIGADIEKRDDSALVSRLGKLINKMEKKKLIEDVNSSMVVQKGLFLHYKSTWRHGLFFFKGGVPTFWGGSKEEELLVLTVIYAAWTTVGDTIILLVGSPNNVLGDKVALRVFLCREPVVSNNLCRPWLTRYEPTSLSLLSKVGEQTNVQRFRFPISN